MLRRLLAILTLALCTAAVSAADRPNILWIIVDDMSANFSCYGEKAIQTPHVDRLAREGTRFANAFITAPVCSPCRSALITGMYQTTIGAHHHRSGRGELKIQLPEGVTPVPLLFKKAGYYTCIGSGIVGEGRKGKNAKKKAAAAAAPGEDGEGKGGAGFGKTDYNFEWPASIYDSPDWAGRKPGQPFFMQVQLSGGKQRGGKAASAQGLLKRAATHFGSATKPGDVTLPPYYPRDPVLLEDWAAYLDAVRFTDEHVGRVLARLESEGILENTIIAFMTDHGISHARGKQFLYNEGTHVPLVLRGPGIAKNEVRDDLIEHIDLTATSLALAGIDIPEKMQGSNVLAPDFQAHDTVFAARDRCDETIERIRSVRTPQFLYIRNFHPQRPHLQPNAYKDGKTIVQRLRELHAEGKLDQTSEKILFSPTRAPEELYDWKSDPWQVHNLANDPAHKATLEKLRARLDQWMADTHDKGPESEAMYDSDMKEYLRRADPVYERNVALMKQWAKEGK
jgi:arylsulfatase A-like enzyme